MKKQKIALNKLVLNKERIANLNQEQQDNVVGGGTVNFCAATAVCQSVVCPTAFCVTHVVAQCLITRAGPDCVIGPVSIAGCNVSLACTITSGGTSVIHQ